MRGRMIPWSIVLLVCACMSCADTPDWDPGTPITGAICVDTPRKGCDWFEPVIILTGEQVTFHANASDYDVQADPINPDGVHCVWSYRPASGGEWTELGKRKGNQYCTCAEYLNPQWLEYTFTTAGTFTIKCVIDDCHIWADDPESSVLTLQVFCVDPCSFSAILVPPSEQ